jgi:hypothetical protein
MVARADFIVESPVDTPQLIVEVKTKTPASPDWAAQMRRNMFAHLALPPSRYFLLALPERFYLWKDAPPLAVTPPDYEIDARQVLEPYLNKLKTPLASLSHSSLEILVRFWLEDLIRSRVDQVGNSQAEKWLVESGLYDAIKHGYIRVHARR